MELCPCCNRTMPKPRRVSAEPADTSTLDVKALYAHYKATAPIEDLKFFLRSPTLPKMVRCDAEALLHTMTQNPLPRAEFYRRLTALQDRWRIVANGIEAAEKLFAQAAEIAGKLATMKAAA